MVLLDASTGDVILKDGTEVIEAFGAHGFPFTRERLRECENRKLEVATAQLNEIIPLLNDIPLTEMMNEVTNDGETVASLMCKCEVIYSFYFKYYGRIFQ